MSIFVAKPDEKAIQFEEKKVKLRDVEKNQLFRIVGAGTFEQAKTGASEDHGTFFMVIPSVPASSDKITAVSIDGNGVRGNPQVFPGVMSVIPHDFAIQIEPAPREPIKTVPE